MRPEIFDATAWELFLGKLAAMKEQALTGEELLERLELAWAPLLQGMDESAAQEIYADVMSVLVSEGIAPPDWAALQLTEASPQGSAARPIE
ncbi:hypothetical protein [Pseudoxanthomonas indica]|uniref:Uncharacterized protein n=1 Tax=Pseudoxanthomonas indica TaxID=428993 RepID=A0A1T5JF18_9GAMM|nr:hypothetical protein [Pseudoxanthomonas indica]GGD58191.1 hypothetical protein GCM10007235_33140 [Pseudoxanthomonas indica]SKC49763.1 hypothetical protein SAMN06296058_0736 [Pseudoxanthomonas indica]